MQMPRKLAAAMFLAALTATAGRAKADIVGVEYSETNSPVVRINESTGGGVAVGNSGFVELNSLAANSSGTLYSAPDSGPSLITVNPITGAGTAFVTINLGVAPDIRGLAFSPSNVLFLANNTGPGGGLNPDQVYTINTSTGAGSLIGETGLTGLQDLCFSPGGTLYGWDVTIGLVTINTTTGVATDVNPSVGATAAIQAIVFAPDGTLYGAQNALFTINAATGATTLVGSGGYSDVRGIEWVAAVPEPATVVLLLIGLAILGPAWRRGMSRLRSDSTSIDSVHSNRARTKHLRRMCVAVLWVSVAGETVPFVLRTPGIQAAEGQAAQALAQPAKDPPIGLAVLPLTASAPNDHFKLLVDAMSDMLMARLSQHQNLKLVERVDLDKVLKEQALGAMQQPGEQARLGKLLKAQYVIVGGVIVDGKELQINLRAVEVATVRIAGTASGTCSADKVIESLGKIGEKLIQEMNLDLPELPPDRVDTSADANLHFMRGLGFYFAQMPEHATSQFMQALAIDPEHAKARWWNAQVYFDGGEYAHARVELDKFLHDHAEHPDAARAKALRARCEPSKASGK